MSRELLMPVGEVKKALKLAHAKGRAAGRHEASRLIRFAATLNGSTGHVLKALATWDETKHPRDHGRFSSAPGSEHEDSSRPDDSHDGSIASIHAAAGRKASRVIAALTWIPKRLLAKARLKINSIYTRLSTRYGKGYARAIVAAGLLGIPIPLPGASVLAAAPVLALAELHRQLSGGPHDPSASDPDTIEHGKRRLFKWLNRTPVTKGFDESKHPRDDRGRFVAIHEIHEARGNAKKAEELRARVTDPEQRKILDRELSRPTAPHELTAVAASKRAAKREGQQRRGRELVSLVKHGDHDPGHLRELAALLPVLTQEDMQAVAAALGKDAGLPHVMVGGPSNLRDRFKAALLAYAEKEERRQTPAEPARAQPEPAREEPLPSREELDRQAEEVFGIEPKRPAPAIDPDEDFKPKGPPVPPGPLPGNRPPAGPDAHDIAQYEAAEDRRERMEAWERNRPNSVAAEGAAGAARAAVEREKERTAPEPQPPEVLPGSEGREEYERGLRREPKVMPAAAQTAEPPKPVALPRSDAKEAERRATEGIPSHAPGETREEAAERVNAARLKQRLELEARRKKLYEAGQAKRQGAGQPPPPSPLPLTPAGIAASQSQQRAEEHAEALASGAVRNAADPVHQAEQLAGYQRGVDRLSGLTEKQKEIFKQRLANAKPTERAAIHAAAVQAYEAAGRAVAKAVDAAGPEHRGKGPGGGQFAPKGNGGGVVEKPQKQGKKPAKQTAEKPQPTKPEGKKSGKIEGETKAGYAPPHEHAASKKLAAAKIKAAPVPPPEKVAKMRAALAAAKSGGRPGGDARGSATDRRRRRRQLFTEWGGDERGYIVCPHTGLKMHWSSDPAENPHGYPLFEQGKIFVARQGGGYQMPNLLPESFEANRSRNDTPIRKENLT